jgi:hypothetical protein
MRKIENKKSISKYLKLFHMTFHQSRLMSLYVLYQMFVLDPVDGYRYSLALTSPAYKPIGWQEKASFC